MSTIIERSEERRGRRGRQQAHKDPWTIEEALTFVRALSLSLEGVGFGVGLTGSVLTDERSDKDLDLIVFPLDSSSFDVQRARYVFAQMGMVTLWDQYEIAMFWNKQGSSDMKYCEVWGYQSKRVDIFFMR